MKWLARLIFSIFISCLFTQVYANLQLSPMVTFIQAKSAFTDITVTNTTNKKQYISTTISNLSWDNDNKTTTVKVEDPDPRKLGLLVTPNKFILAPGGSRKVRIQRTQPPEAQEKIYIVAFKPEQTPQIISTSADPNGITANINISIAFGARVGILPSKSIIDFDITREGTQVTLHNKSNIAIYFTSGKQCTNANDCIDLPSQLVYPGAHSVKDVPTPARVTYVAKIDNGETQTVASN